MSYSPTVKNDSVKNNPNSHNDRAPSSLPKNDQSSSRSAPSKGSPLPIPSTRGYVGKRINPK